MRLENGDVLLAWPLEKHLLTAGNYYRGTGGTYKTWHGAIDLRCTWDGTTAQPVYAAEDGTVNWVQAWDGHTKTGDQSYGNCVKILHNNYGGKKLETLYAHLAATCVSKGQRVREGDVIGYTGDSGNSGGAHLHFEVRLAGVRKNPLCWLDADFEAASGYVPYTYGPGEVAVERAPVEAVPEVQAKPETVTATALMLGTIGPASKGDRVQISQLAEQLGIPLSWVGV